MIIIIITDNVYGVVIATKSLQEFISTNAGQLHYNYYSYNKSAKIKIVSGRVGLTFSAYCFLIKTM